MIFIKNPFSNQNPGGCCPAAWQRNPSEVCCEYFRGINHIIHPLTGIEYKSFFSAFQPRGGMFADSFLV